MRFLPRIPLRRNKQTFTKSLQATLGFEALEHRRVLAAYISELHFDPLFGSGTEDQYLELRGEPREVIAEGTYFLGIESADGVGELGDIHTIIDLGGQTFGANGFLVLAQSVAPGVGYSVDSAATLLSGTNGFEGMPGFSSDNSRGEIHAGSSTYLLVQADVPPTLADDIDGNDDGIPDGAYLGWTVLDGFTTLPRGESVWTQRAYAPIVFSEDGVGDSFLPGSTVIQTVQQAYAGRIGASTGYTEEDWLSGNTVEANTDQFDFQFQHGVFGTPRPPVFGGRVLDHVGAPNWYGSVAGTVFDDVNGDGVFQAGEPTFEDINVSVEYGTELDNGYVWERIEPNDYEVGTDLSNISKRITLISAGDNNVPQGFKARAVQRAFAPDGEHVFAHEGVGFFNDDRRLRMDFYNPAHAVSINFIGNSLQETYGRLEIFNKNDESLGFVRTAPLLDDQEQRLTLVSDNDEIAWALAYSDNEYLSSSPFGMLDDLQFQAGRPATVSTSGGRYFIGNLPEGSYTIRAQGNATYNDATQSVIINNTESYPNTNLGLTDKFPKLEDQNFAVGELAQANEVLAILPVKRGYTEQQLEFRFLAGNEDGLFSINPTTFELTLQRAELDFETKTSFTLELEIKDVANADLVDTATVQLEILNENDPPVVVAQEVELDENSAIGTPIAVMQGSDQDSGTDGDLLWRISGGNEDDAFSIDAGSGEITLRDNAAINFESNPVFELVVRAVDGGTPPAIGEATLTVRLKDVNEVPTINNQVINVIENSPGGTIFAQLGYVDEDQGQTGTWSILDGDGASVFDVTDDGKLSVANDVMLDFETLAEYSLNVRLTDSGEPALSDERIFSIGVIDINDAPELLEQTFTVDENSLADAEVGQVAGSDEDAGQTLTFAITGGSHASMFEIDAATGMLSVATDVELDHEALAEASVEVTATDSHSSAAFTAALMTIQIADVNEAPEISAVDMQIDENSPAGSEGGQLTASDPDTFDILSFEIQSQTLPWLSVVPETGALTVADGANIDFEAGLENVVTVQVTDAGGLSSQATITVTANDVNDAPELATPLSDATVNVGEALNYSIPEEAFTDQDAGDSVSYMVTTEAGFSLPSWISFDATNRTLKGTPTAGELGTLNVKVTAIDTARASAFDVFAIDVQPEPFAWHNNQNAFDVSGDGFVSPVDALMVVNYLNNTETANVPDGAPPEFGLLDVNADNFVTPFDALVVINELNQQGGEGEGHEMARSLLPLGFPGIANVANSLEDEDDDEERILELLAQEQLKSAY